ncbi:MAG: Gar1/Naf1 family protein [Candidatus Bathyarchaeota archaeon]|nr:Gar1/Naf1 family protein [Candidatus Bathyarchaeota archaeon]
MFKKLSAGRLAYETSKNPFCRKIYKLYYGERVCFSEGNVLQRLGKVLNVTPSQSVIVKLEKTPKMGAAIIDEKLNVVGRVFDIIGPVSSPYAVIKPSVKHPETLANHKLYVSPSKKERR